MTLYEAANPTPATGRDPEGSEIGGAGNVANLISLNATNSTALKAAPEDAVPTRASRLDSQPELPERSVNVHALPHILVRTSCMILKKNLLSSTSFSRIAVLDFPTCCASVLRRRLSHHEWNSKASIQRCTKRLYLVFRHQHKL